MQFWHKGIINNLLYLSQLSAIILFSFTTLKGKLSPKYYRILLQ